MSGKSRKKKSVSKQTQSNSPPIVTHGQRQKLELMNETHEVLSLSHSSRGPIPSPEVIREYGEVDPSFPERIMKTYEKQTEHRHLLEKQDADDRSKDLISVRNEAQRGQYFALIIGLSGMGAGVYLTSIGHWEAGVTFGGGTIAALCSVFIIGKKTAIKTSKSENDDD